MAGQMIIVGFHGTNKYSPQYLKVKNQLKKGKITGVLVYEFNVKDPLQIKELNQGLLNSGAKFKPLIGVDEEGGQVQILKEENGFKSYPTAHQISKINDLNEVYKIYSDMAIATNGAGFNLNFAPDVDLLLNKNSIIAKKERSYGESPNKVIKYAKVALKANYDNNLITSIKHFPGHGSVAGDTHMGFVDASKTWSEIELEPYKALKNENDMQMVMTSHVFIDKLDKNYPASLSNKITTGILRDKIGFSGVIITDDLNMGAIRDNYTLEEIVINAINAGNDILMFSNYYFPDMKTPEKVIKIVKKAVKEGKIKEERLVESYNRILKLKAEL